MKMRSLVFLLSGVFLGTVAFGGEPGDTWRTMCSVNGSWFAAAEGSPWTATFSNTSFADGSLVTEWTGGDGDWYGHCAGSVRFTNGLGTWTQKGPRTLLYTIITFSLDEFGDVVCTWKLSGRIVLDAGCDSGRQSGSIELFYPDANPFMDEPFHFFPREGETEFVRMTVDPCRE
jgi:hypothetical protein